MSRFKYFICIKNNDYSSSLEIRKIYRAISDKSAEENNLLRIMDETGEDYLYPKEYFVSIEIPLKVKNTFKKELA